MSLIEREAYLREDCGMTIDSPQRPRSQSRESESYEVGGRAAEDQKQI